MYIQTRFFDLYLYDAVIRLLRAVFFHHVRDHGAPQLPKTNERWSRLYLDYAGPIRMTRDLSVQKSYDERQNKISETLLKISNVRYYCIKQWYSISKLPQDLSGETCNNSSYHPRSNRESERFVGILKGTLGKS